MKEYDNIDLDKTQLELNTTVNEPVISDFNDGMEEAGIDPKEFAKFMSKLEKALEKHPIILY